MSAFKDFGAVAPQGSCIKVFCTKSVPEKLITFHRALLNKVTPQDYNVLILEDANLEEIFTQLSITFLGQTSVYAFKDAILSAANRKKFTSFLKEYTGPHTLYFFTSDPLYEKNAVPFETVITKKSFIELARLNGNALIAPTFIERLFQSKASYTFDESLTLMAYADLLGARSEIFFSAWIERILGNDLSLFSVSQYFFAQQKKLLLQEWLRLKDRYPHEFWIAFFSEQLWQAALYTHYAQQGKAAEAKRYAYRLPFSYLRKDWKKYSLSTLRSAHDFLYQVDYGLKNGYATTGLELFIHTALKGPYA